MRGEKNPGHSPKHPEDERPSTVPPENNSFLPEEVGSVTYITNKRSSIDHTKPR
jgi:hypothetical protein